MKIRTNCKFYKGTMPCIFNKLDGRICRQCKDYISIKEKILIIKLGAQGDVLRTTSILPAIKKKYPYCHITWVTKKEAAPLLRNNNFIDIILDIEENYLEFILSQEYDISFCLDAEPLSASVNNLSRAAVKMGFITDKKGRVIPANKEARQWYLMGVNDSFKKANRKTYFEHIYKMCRLQLPYFKPQYILTKKQLEAAEQFKIKNGLRNFSTIVGINTGGGTRWQLKKWILDYYVEIIRLLKANFPKVGILLYGGKAEEEFNKKIADNVRDLVVDTGCKNPVDDFAVLVSVTDIFLTPDSLGMHLSTALEKNTLVLVGPTSPWELDVFGKGEVIYNRNLDCIGCYWPSCEKITTCMNSVTPEQILKILGKYINHENSNR